MISSTQEQAIKAKYEALKSELKVSDEALAQVNVYPADFHGNDWNYVIKPRDKNQ